ncbi:MAG: hypothetical protein NVSMB1_07530 [Polyangiales bacterium]
MQIIDVAGLSSNARLRFEFLLSFMAFTDDDWAALKASAPILGSKLPALLDAVYHHLLSFDDTRRLFLGDRGEVDPRFIAIRKEHLTDWVLTTIAGGDREAFAQYLVKIARHHTSLAGERKRNVPPRYIVGLFSFVQSAILSALFDSLPDDPANARRYALSWNKMLMIQLEMFLKEIGPHWPRWDEG